MLDKIYDENWNQLLTLSGDASLIPNSVLRLITSNRSDFDSAYWQIENQAIVQGDLFSCASLLPKYLKYVVVETKFKREVIDLIWQIGTGYSHNNELKLACFHAAEQAFKYLLDNPQVIGKKYHSIVLGELDDMYDINL